MIIWKGRGILVPIFALLGFLVGSLLTRAVSDDIRVGVIVPMWIAAVGVWVFALTLGKSSTLELADPKTGQRHRITRSHTFFFLPGIAWAVVATLIAAFTSVGGLSLDDEGIPSAYTADHYQAPQAGKEAFEAANAKITSNREGVAFGNTVKAQLLAEAFSTTAKSLRELAIQQGKKRMSLSGGDFVTYAYLTPTRCVFLVHVPQLRDFTKEAKETMGEIAWITAQRVATEIDPVPETLAVGVRGAVLYDRALSGVFVEEMNDERDGIRKEVTGTTSKQLLATLFTPEPILAATRPKPPEESVPTEQTPMPTEEEPKGETTTQVPDESPKEDGTPTATVAEPSPDPIPVAKPDAAEDEGTLPTAIRDWADQSGRPLRASLIRKVDPEGTLGEFRREDGQLFTVPVERFSATDQATIRQLFAE